MEGLQRGVPAGGPGPLPSPGPRLTRHAREPQEGPRSPGGTVAFAGSSDACGRPGRAPARLLIGATPALPPGVTRPAFAVWPRDRAALIDRKQGGCRGATGSRPVVTRPIQRRLAMGGAPSDGRAVALEKEEQASIRTGLQGTRGTRRTLGSEASFRCSGRASLSRSLALSEPPSLYLHKAGTSWVSESWKPRSGHTRDAGQEPPLASRSDGLWATQTTNPLRHRTEKDPSGTKRSRSRGGSRRWPFETACRDPGRRPGQRRVCKTEGPPRLRPESRPLPVPTPPHTGSEGSGRVLQG